MKHEHSDGGAKGEYEPLARTVAQHLRDAILDGAIKRGAPIRQEAVANELGVSRIPVREALRLLEAEGLVTIRPHRSARVAVLDFADCIEIYKMRERLEPLAFGESIGSLTEEQIAALHDLAAQIETLTSDLGAWLEADRQFHLACYAGANAPRLVKTVEGYWRTTQQYRRILLESFTPSDFSTFQCDHRIMVAAAEDRHRSAGEDIVRLHLERSRRRLSQQRDRFDQ